MSAGGRHNSAHNKVSARSTFEGDTSPRSAPRDDTDVWARSVISQCYYSCQTSRCKISFCTLSSFLPKTTYAPHPSIYLMTKLDFTVSSWRQCLHLQSQFLFSQGSEMSTMAWVTLDLCGLPTWRGIQSHFLHKKEAGMQLKCQALSPSRMSSFSDDSTAPLLLFHLSCPQGCEPEQCAVLQLRLPFTFPHFAVECIFS